MIRPRLGRIAVVLTAALAALGGTASAATFSACTAADIVALDSKCPPTGACDISNIFIIGNGCTLDFGTRAVTVLSSGELRILTNTVTVKAGSFTVAGGGVVNAKGDDVPPNDNGGFVSFITSGAFTIARAGTTTGLVDLSGRTLGGVISIDAGGTVTIQGRLKANNIGLLGTGGLIVIDSASDIQIDAGSVVAASGGPQGSGGAITLAASGRILISDTIDVQGGEAGLFSIVADADAVVGQVLGNATGDGGTGASVSVEAGTTLQMLGKVFAKGTSANDGSYGGDGGDVDLAALYGDLIVGADIIAESATPDGSGGSVTLSAAGSILVQSAAPISVRGNGGESSGGDFTVDAGFDVRFDSAVDASGGFDGGIVDITARRDIFFNQAMDASGRVDGGYGGVVLAVAGSEGKGSVFVNQRIDTRGGGCSLLGGCGGGGAIDLFGCNVTVDALGQVWASAPDGGAITLNARELLTVSGSVDAHSTSTTGTQGAVGLEYPSRLPPVIVPGTVLPTPDFSARNTCTGPGQQNCLDPCPTCGDGVVVFPETCDQLGPPVGCDGCSTFCQLENCNDQNGCTTDSCSPTLGCRHVGVPDGSSCSDGLVCNGGEICAGAVCLPGVAPNCDDAKVCTLDSCAEPGGCTHVPAPPTVPCNDNNACTQNDQCDGAGQCAPGVPLMCDDGLECTDDACISTFGCVFTPHTGPCTDDGKPCTDDVCNLGLCMHPFRANGTACDDGQYCTVSDMCFVGLCIGGQSRSCADASACTIDTCDELIDMCVHSPAVSCCGNGNVEPGEECDDGNQSDTDACLGTCRNATCGDGVVHAGVEECDAGAANSNAPNACRPNCMNPRCGDGVLDDLGGEQCDDGNATPGDGCSPTCFLEPPPTAEAIGGKGSATSDCIVEWKMDRPELDKKGLPSTKQTCRDNDPLCDFDSAPGVCVFHLWVCANVHDPNLPLCAPGAPSLGTPVLMSVQKPRTRDGDRRAEDAQNLAALLSTVPSLQTSALDACGPRLSLRVPLKSPIRKGSKALKIRAVTERNIVDSDQLKLYCTP